MNTSNYTPPRYLEPGDVCILITSKANKASSEYEEVTFLEDTSSPIVVIVQNHKGQVLRVSRSDLQEKSSFDSQMNDI